MRSAFVAVMDFASVTATVKLEVPGEVGVPEITPVVDAKAKPLGSDPEAMDQV